MSDPLPQHTASIRDSEAPLEIHIKWLKEHFDDKISASEARLTDRIAALDRHCMTQFEEQRQAVDKAEKQVDKRLEGMNEIRDTLNDQASRLATKDETKGIREMVDVNRDAIGRCATESEFVAMRDRMETFATKSLTVALEQRMSKIELSLANTAGKASSATVLWSVLSSLAVALVTAFFVKFGGGG